MSEQPTFQRRYQAYLDKTGAEHREGDPKHNAEFVCWLGRRLREFKEQAGIDKHRRLTQKNHANFDDYLRSL